ncbi:MAG: hypothetical protein K0S65_1756 [Labilithrix sp.]|jgi:hypothetical protein|nr:hypothetical protein [Labilithrix sp.]
MDRRLVFLSALAILGLVATGCRAGARGSARAAHTQPSSAPSPSPTFEAEPAPPPAVASAAPGAAAAPSAPVCPLVCHVANKGRVAPPDEERLTSSLAEVAQAIHACVRGQAPSLTLRFDSTGALTALGVDHTAEEGDAACLDAVNQRRPSVSYPGPATVRCVERCAAAR